MRRCEVTDEQWKIIEPHIGNIIIDKECHLVEHFFMKIKDYRRVAMRFEKLAGRFLAMVRLASCLVWLA